MATFGTANTTNHDGRRSVNGTYINGGLFGATAGTLDSVSIFGDEDGGGFNKYRLAVYQGGTSDVNPAGASLIWDSGEQTCPSGAAAWRTVNAGGQALAANTRTWVCVRTGDQFHPHYPVSGEFGDATFDTKTWSQNSSSTAYESTVPAISADGSGPGFKWYLNFTEASSGSLTVRRKLLETLMRCNPLGPRFF
jgi:hypothetical protein